MWKQEEKQEFFNLLKEHYLSEAARRFSKSSGKSMGTIISWFRANKRKGKIPEDILDALHSNKEKWSPSEEKELLDDLKEFNTLNNLKPIEIET